jgi:phosphoserine phosphatase RsbU/P
VFFHDISEKKQKERALQAAERDFALLVESVEEYAIFMLDASGRIKTWNRGAARIKGYCAEEIIGQSYELFFPAQARAEGAPAAALEAATREGHFQAEAWRVRKDGSHFLADVTLTAIRDASGALEGFAKVTRDLTERTRVQQEREHLLENLNLNERFCSVLAHDLRTPLAAILMNAQLLSRRGRDSASVSVADRIAASAERMTRMIAQLLDVSRARSLAGIPIERRPIDLAHVCREGVAEILSAHPDRKVEFEALGDCTGEWDPDRLAQVLSNLLANAVHHSEPGSRVTVRLDGTGEDVVELRATNQAAIPAHLLPVLFEPFEHFTRAQQGQRGLGLGLYIAREIARGHGGRIDVHTQGGETTTFIVTLPRH